MSVAVDVPDEDKLARKQTRVNDGLRIDESQASLELRGRGHAVVDQLLCDADERGVARRIDDQLRRHDHPDCGSSVVHGRAAPDSKP
jgi:hypothetical protein